MEPSGRKRWQPLANATAAKAAQMGDTVAVGCYRLPGNAMLRRGSTVRVVKGLYKSAGNRHFLWDQLQELQYAVGRGPYMELSDSERIHNQPLLCSSRRAQAFGRVLSSVEKGISGHGCGTPGTCSTNRGEHPAT
jgi:hypothetical protein